MKYFIFLFSITQFIYAQKTIDVSNYHKDTLVYAPNAEIYADTNFQIDSMTILHPSLQFADFKPGTCSSPSVKSYWMRTKVKTNSDGKWLMEFLDPHIYKLSLFEKTGNTLKKIHPTVGFGLPFSQKKHYYKNFLFDINASSRDTTTYYIHFETHLVNCFLFKLRPASDLLQYALIEYPILFFYYGVLTLMGIYNLIIFLRMKESVYLFYVLYVLACIIISLAEDGLGFQYLWASSPKFNLFIENWKSNILLISFTLYSIYFLNLYKRHKKASLACIALVGSYLFANIINYQYYSGLLNLRWLFLCPVILLYYYGFQIYSRGSAYVKFYLIGTSFLLICLIINLLRTYGIHPFHWVVDIYAFNMGFILEVIVLSYALVERLRNTTLLKQQAQQNVIAQMKETEKIKQAYTLDLEQKVKERTYELEQANEEIKAFNDFLESKNLKLELEAEKTSKARAASQLLTLEEFKKIYSDEDVCKDILSKIKWGGQAFICTRCGSKSEVPHKPHYRRCADCKYVESVTTATLFHAIKTPLPEAFYMVYAVMTQPKVTAEELCTRTGVSDKSCAAFKKKILEAEALLRPKQRKKGWIALLELSL